MSGLLVGPVADGRHLGVALVLSSDSAVNTMRFSPDVLQVDQVSLTGILFHWSD